MDFKITYMKFILFILYSLAPFTIYSQAKKPTIMVVPSDAWCIKNGYSIQIENLGQSIQVPNYKAALQGSSELLLVISKINELMSDRGFPLVNLESSIKNLEALAAEDAMLISNSGDELAISPIDLLKSVSNADIWIQITWDVNQIGPKKSVTFNLQGIDAYTNKQISGASGTGQPSFSAELPVLLEESIISNIDNFNFQLQSHFDDLFLNGREISIRIKVWSNWEYDLESEDFGDDELGFLIEDWVYNNAIQGRFNTSIATENMMLFEQVRIPLLSESGRPIDARRWVNDLRKHLSESYGIESKLMMKGLGQAQLVLGEK